MVLLSVVLGGVAAWFGSRWGTSDALAQGASDDIVRTAGLLLACAAFLVVCAGCLLLVLLLAPRPGRTSARVIGIVLTIPLIAMGVVLYVRLYPMLLEQ